MPDLKRILLAEDDPHDIELTLEALEEHKLANEVVVVRDGEEAMNYLLRRGNYSTLAPGNPVVVLLDIKMPKKNGLEVLREMKDSAQLKMIPVVMLTSSREEPDLKQSYELGVSGYVVKPVDFPKFLDVVKELGVFWALINEPPPGSVRRRH